MSYDPYSDEIPAWLRAALEGCGDPSDLAIATSRLIVLHLWVLRERARDPAGVSALAERLGATAESAVAQFYDWVVDALEGVGDISERREELAWAVAHEIDDPSYSRIPNRRRELAAALERNVATRDARRDLAERLADALVLAGGGLTAYCGAP
jgi:hypothetical protein